MKDILHFEPLIHEKFDTYIAIGTKAYLQHYLHLWPHQDPSPYIDQSFTREVLQKEKNNPNIRLFLIQLNQKGIGIIKITLHKSLEGYTDQEALYVDKVYILREFTGRGIGKKIIRFIQLRAQEMGKKVIWLDTMQKGPAVSFYLQNGFTVHCETTIPFKNVIEKEKTMYIMAKTL